MSLLPANFQMGDNIYRDNKLATRLAPYADYLLSFFLMTLAKTIHAEKNVRIYMYI